MSFTCGSLGQQRVQWMLHNCLIRALKQASWKHSPVLGFSQMLNLVLSPPCHLKSILVLSASRWRDSLFTVNDCCPLADFEVNQEGTPLDTTYSLTVFLAAYNKFDAVLVKFINSLLFLKIEWNNYIIQNSHVTYLYFILFCTLCTYYYLF